MSRFIERTPGAIRRHLLGVMALVAACTTLIAAGVDGRAQHLEPKRAEKLEKEVIPAFRAGDHLALLKALSPMVSGMDDATLVVVDERLAARNVPPVGEILTTARMQLVQLGFESELPKPHWRESLLSLEAISRLADNMLDRKQAHPALSDPNYAPATFLSYERLFTQLHAVELQLADTRRLAQHAAELVNQNARINRKKLTPEQERILDRDYGRLAEDLAGHQRHVRQRQLELRANRLSEAEYVLRLSESETERFTAACALNQDADQLMQALDANPAPDWLDASWSNPDRKSLIRHTIAEATGYAGPELMRKGQLLADGLTWWLRGRYGRSAIGAGLVKSERAKRDPRANVALWMPDTMPVPTAPGDTYQPSVPRYDRRHHYTWNWENRDIVVVSGDGAASTARGTRVTSGQDVVGVW